MTLLLVSIALLCPFIHLSSVIFSAKRVFLQYLGSIPYQLTPAPNCTVTLTPYKGPDGQAILAHTQRGPRSERRSSVASHDAAMTFAAGNVSPAVSMILMAAAAATGPPGALGGTLNGPTPNYPSLYQQQQFNGQQFPASHASNINLPSSFGQGNVIPDTFSYGYSISSSLSGSMSASSSWSDSSSFSNNRVNGRNGALSLLPTTIPLSRSGLEDIAEASSREELPQSQMPSRSASVAPDCGTNIVITKSTPISDTNFERQQVLAMELNGINAPHGKSTSDTEQSGLPWLSREPSPTPSLPSLHKSTSLNELVNGTKKLSIQGNRLAGDVDDVSSEGEKLSESAYNHRVGTPPDGRNSPGKTATPPRVGNPAKRMLGHALGIRHPSLPPRVIAGATPTN